MCAVVEDLGSDGADEHEAAAVVEHAQPDLGVLLLVVDVPGLGAAVTNVNDQDKLHEVGDGEASEKDGLGEGEAAKDDGLGDCEAAKDDGLGDGDAAKDQANIA